MNLAQYIADTARAAKIHEPKTAFQEYLEEKVRLSHQRILAALEEPRTTSELKRMLGYSNGGMYAMINKLKGQEKIYCVGEIKIGCHKHRLWAKSAK